MNHARHLGNSVGIYSTEFDERSQRHLALIGEAREALNTEQFQLYYQPKLDLRRRQVTGVEALVRWQHRNTALSRRRNSFRSSSKPR